MSRSGNSEMNRSSWRSHDIRLKAARGSDGIEDAGIAVGEFIKRKKRAIVI